MKKLTFLLPMVAALVLAGAGCAKKDTVQVNPVDSGAGAVDMAEKDGGMEVSGDSGANDHFAKLFANFKDMGTQDFRADMTFSGSQSDGLTMVMKRDAPDKYHMISTSPQNGTSEIIYANEKNYIKGPGQDTWIVMPSVDIPDMVESYTSDEKLAENVGDPATAKYQGKKPCGSLKCHVYDVVVEEGTSVIAFDTKEFLLRTVTFTATNGDVTDIVYTYEDIIVTVPTNVQEMELPGGMTQEDLQRMMQDAQVQMAQ